MKQNIKGNREKYKQQEKEFEGVIDEKPPQVVELDVIEEEQSSAPKEDGSENSQAVV